MEICVTCIYIYIKLSNQSTTKGFVYGLIQFTGKFYEISERKKLSYHHLGPAQISILWQTFSCDVHKKLLLEKKRAESPNKGVSGRIFSGARQQKGGFQIVAWSNDVKCILYLQSCGLVSSSLSEASGNLRILHPQTLPKTNTSMKIGL